MAALYRPFLLVLTLLALGGCARGLLAPQWGLQEGRLNSCDGLRGCVSSQSQVGDHHIAPLTYTSSKLDARNDLYTVVSAFRDAQVVSVHPSYLRVEFVSREIAPAEGRVVYGASSTVDIAEFYFPDDEHTIHVRSTPRRNMPDSGENRARIESIRVQFRELQTRRQ